MITGDNSFQIWAQDNNTFRMILKKFRQKWLVKKSKFVGRKKNPTRAQTFRYFRIESRNKKFNFCEDKLDISNSNEKVYVSDPNWMLKRCVFRVIIRAS